MRLLLIILSFIYVGCFGQMTMNARHFTARLDTATGGSSLTNGLLAVWELDETSGTLVNDELGTYDFTNSGANVNQTGLLSTGTAYSFTTDDYCYGVQDDFELQTFSISLWFSTSIATFTDAGVFSNSVFGSSTYEGWALYFDSEFDYTGGITFMVNGYLIKLSTTTGVAETGQVNDGNPHHVVVTFTSGEQVMYLDGSQVDSDTWSGTILYSAANIPTLGDFAGAFFPGVIDQVAIWNRVLDSGEATGSTLYNSGSGTPYSGW